MVEQFPGGLGKAHVDLGAALADGDHLQLHVVAAEMVGVHDAVVVVQSPGDEQAGEGVGVAAGLDVGGNRAFTAGIELQELLVLQQRQREDLHDVRGEGLIALGVDPKAPVAGGAEDEVHGELLIRVGRRKVLGRQMEFGPHAGQLGEHVHGPGFLVAGVRGHLRTQQGAIEAGRRVGEIGRMGHDAVSHALGTGDDRVVGGLGIGNDGAPLAARHVLAGELVGLGAGGAQAPFDDPRDLLQGPLAAWAAGCTGEPASRPATGWKGCSCRSAAASDC